MTGKQKKRLLQALVILAASALVISLILLSLKESIQLYYSPNELVDATLRPQQTVRMGGLVMQDSLVREPNSLKVHFDVTDGLRTVRVTYEGVLPDLFREGQGVIVKGTYLPGTGFQASEVLTKHDERYVPKELQHTLGAAPV